MCDVKGPTISTSTKVPLHTYISKYGIFICLKIVTFNDVMVPQSDSPKKVQVKFEVLSVQVVSTAHILFFQNFTEFAVLLLTAVFMIHCGFV